MVRSASTKPSSAVSLLQGLFFFSFYRARSFLFLFLFTGTGLAVATIGAMGSSVVTGMMLSRSLCYLVIIWYDVCHLPGLVIIWKYFPSFNSLHTNPLAMSCYSLFTQIWKHPSILTQIRIKSVDDIFHPRWNIHYIQPLLK